MIAPRFNTLAQSLGNISVLRLVMLCAGLALLAGCVAPPEPVAPGESFRVSSVTVRFFQTGEGRVPLKFLTGEDMRFPRSDIGLSRAKVETDFKHALERSLIPGSRGGARDVRVQLKIYALTLRGGMSYGYTNAEYITSQLVGWLDFIDAQSGEVLVANKEFLVNSAANLSLNERLALTRKRSNVVREYDVLISLVAAEAPKFLP